MPDNKFWLQKKHESEAKRAKLQESLTTELSAKALARLQSEFKNKKYPPSDIFQFLEKHWAKFTKEYLKIEFSAHLDLKLFERREITDLSIFSLGLDVWNAQLAEIEFSTTQPARDAQINKLVENTLQKYNGPRLPPIDKNRAR